MPFRLDRWFKKGGDSAHESVKANGDSPWPHAEKNYANPLDDVHIWEFEPEMEQGAEVQIVTPMSVYDVVCQHAHGALPNETGGFLMGQVGRDIARRRWHLYIDKAEPVVPV